MADITIAEFYEDRINQKDFNRASVAIKKKLAVKLFTDFAQQAREQGLIESYAIESPHRLFSQFRVLGLQSEERIKNDGAFGTGKYAIAARAQNIILSHSGLPGPKCDIQVDLDLLNGDYESLRIFARYRSPELKGLCYSKAEWLVGEGFQDDRKGLSEHLDETFSSFARGVMQSGQVIEEHVSKIQTYLNTHTPKHESYSSFKGRTRAL